MAETYRRQSALAALGLEARVGAGTESAGVVLCERSFRAQIVLRGDASKASFLAPVEQVLGAVPPVEAHTTNQHRRNLIIWCGPNEWLMVLPDGRQAKVLADLRAALGNEHHALVDVSHGCGVIGLAGDRAREVLMKGCSLDLHPSRFSAGQVAQSGLARCHVLLHQLDDAPSYDLYVHRSFMRYAWAWLEDASTEYGLTIEAQRD